MTKIIMPGGEGCDNPNDKITDRIWNCAVRLAGNNDPLTNMPTSWSPTSDWDLMRDLLEQVGHEINEKPVASRKDVEVDIVD